MEEIKNSENNEEKGFLDKIQDKFYEKRANFDDFIFKSFIITVTLVFLAVLAGSQFQHLFIYLCLPFSAAFVVTAILATTYFIVAVYFRKRSIEKYLEKPKTYREKFLKFSYTAIKFLLGFGFVWTFVGDSILTLIFDKQIQSSVEGYNLTAIKLLSSAVLLLLLYCGIVVSSYSAHLVGFGDRIAASNSIFNLASKRSFVMFLGGFFVCFGLLFASVILDSKISVALNAATAKMEQAAKIQREKLHRESVANHSN